jgi:hypothetical protein
MDYRTTRNCRGTSPMRNIRNYLFLLIFLLSNTVLAGDGLGRLFLTPDQRSQLETVRAQRDRRLPATTDTETAPAARILTAPDVVTYNGMVRRNDGASTVWINGKPTNEHGKGINESDVNVLGLRRDGTVAVAIPQAGRRASLKVGQSLEVTSGAIEESYARRATLIRPQVNTPTPSAALAATPAKPVARPARERDAKEAYPDGDAAPAIPLGTLKTP